MELNKLIILVLWRLNAEDEAIPKHWQKKSCWMPIEHYGSADLFNQLAKTIIHIRAYARLLARAAAWDRNKQTEKLLLQPIELKAVWQNKTWLKQNLQDALALTSLQSKLIAASDQRNRDQRNIEKAKSKHGQPDIFISYSHKDQEFVEKLCKALQQKEKDWNLWVDWENIPGAANWRQEVTEGIQEAHTFLFVISPNSVDSEHCKAEITLANKLNKRRIPVLLQQGYDEEKYNDTGLDSLQWVPFAEHPV